VKYPEVVENLVLISPVGIPHPPPIEEQLKPSELDWRIRTIDQLWKWNFTPQGVVRVMGSRGPKMVSDVVNRRFNKRWEGEELALIADYLYHITAAPGSGEYALSALLEPVFMKPVVPKGTPPSSAAISSGKNKSTDSEKRRGEQRGRGTSGVFAKLPLENELSKLKIPILLLYGDNDWLYYPTAEESINLNTRFKMKNIGIEGTYCGERLDVFCNSFEFSNRILCL